MMKTKKKASVLVLTTIFILLLFISMGFAIDLGGAYVFKAKLQVAADHASQAGSTVVGDMILEKAQANLDLNPNQDDSNVLELLTEEDISEILMTAYRVEARAEEYLLLNEQSHNLEIYDYQIEYPYEYSQESQLLLTRVNLQASYKFYFSAFLGEDAVDIEVESVSSIPIRN